MGYAFTAESEVEVPVIGGLATSPLGREPGLHRTVQSSAKPAALSLNSAVYHSVAVVAATSRQTCLQWSRQNM